MRHLYIDIETIPCQGQVYRDEIARQFTEIYTANVAELKLDIEALKPPANLKDPVKIEAWKAEDLPKKKAVLEQQIQAAAVTRDARIEDAWRKTSFDGALCQIVVIGAARDDEKPLALQSKEPLTLAGEAQLLRAFFSMLELVPEPERMVCTWVGHNVIDFDLRVLYQRAVIHGIRPPFWIPFHSKPWGDRVFDTMLAWAGQRGRVSQDKLCRVLGIDAKGSELGDEIDGSRVWDFVKAGRIAEVATYCAGDVHRAREAHRRLTFWEAPSLASVSRIA